MSRSIRLHTISSNNLEVTILSNERRDFCIECRREKEYILQKKDIIKNIKDKDYNFSITVAICTE